MRISTRRLELRPLEAADLEPLHALMTSSAVRQYLWDDRIVSVGQIRRMLDENTAMFAEHRFGLWGAFRCGAQELIGFAGLWRFRDPPKLELVFGVSEELWGQGLGTELARAVTDHAVTNLGLSTIVGSTDATNVASCRVLEKCDFAFDRREIADGIDTVFYVFSKPDCASNCAS